jgi:hypothetical protein
LPKLLGLVSRRYAVGMSEQDPVLALRERQVRLARRERAAYNRMLDLQCELDRVACELERLTMSKPHMLAGVGFDNLLSLSQFRRGRS